MLRALVVLIVILSAAAGAVIYSTDGKDVTVKVTKDTRVKAKPGIKVEAIKVGTRTPAGN